MERPTKPRMVTTIMVLIISLYGPLKFIDISGVTGFFKLLIIFYIVYGFNIWVWNAIYDVIDYIKRKE